jgi:hypothetical protein
MAVSALSWPSCNHTDTLWHLHDTRLHCHTRSSKPARCPRRHSSSLPRAHASSWVGPTSPVAPYAQISWRCFCSADSRYYSRHAERCDGICAFYHPRAWPWVFSNTHATTCALGIPRESKPFHPHLTLARIRKPAHSPHLLSLLHTYRTQDFGDMPVTTLHLVQSQLHRTGAVYTLLSSVPLQHIEDSNDPKAYNYGQS